MTSHAKISVTGSVVDGVVVDALLNHAAAKGIDLVVMTTHGRGPVGRFWLGSVADEMIRRLQVPILLVRPQEEKPDFSKQPVFRKVLIPLDGTALSEKILDYALPLVRLMQAELILLRAIQPTVFGQPSLGEWAPATFDRTLLEKLEAMDKEQREQAGSHLDKLAAGLRSASLSVRTYLVTHDQPAVAILNEARTQEADLIALPSGFLTLLPWQRGRQGNSGHIDSGSRSPAAAGVSITATLPASISCAISHAQKTSFGD